MTLLCRCRILGILRATLDDQPSLRMNEVKDERTETADANGRVTEEDEECIDSNGFECEEGLRE